MSNQAMREALAALENYSKSDYIKRQHPKRRAAGEKAIAKLRAALAQAEQQQEAVAWRAWSEAHGYTVWETLEEAKHYSDEDHDPEPLDLRNSRKKAEAQALREAAYKAHEVVRICISYGEFPQGSGVLHDLRVAQQLLDSALRQQAVGINGLTEAETEASASVMGLVRQQGENK